MRAVLVLLALGLVAWGVFQFLPTSAVEGKESGEDAPAIRFLDRPAAAGEEAAPAPAPASAEPERTSPPAATLAPTPQAAPADAPGAFGLRASDVSSSGSDDLELARALLFGRPGDVERAVARLSLPEGEGRFYRAFAEALGGNRKVGLDLAQGLDDPALLEPEDRALLQAALAGDAKPTARPASSRKESLARRAMRLKLVERDAALALEEERFADAAQAYSDLLLAGLKGPWEAERRSLQAWTEGLNRAQARYRWDPRGGWPGAELEVQEGDSLTVVRKRFLADHPDGLLCTGQIQRANQLTGVIHPGDKLRIPTDRASTLVDLSSRWLLYLLGDEVAGAWEVGIGRDGQETIVGTFRAGDKQEKPTWFKRGQDPLAYPDNPLGTRWIAWHRDGAKTGYGFHGTWEPESIGTAASDGCIRLRNEDVELLFEILPVGAQIEVQE